MAKKILSTTNLITETEHYLDSADQSEIVAIHTDQHDSFSIKVFKEFNNLPNCTFKTKITIESKEDHIVLDIVKISGKYYLSIDKESDIY